MWISVTRRPCQNWCLPASLCLRRRQDPQWWWRTKWAICTLRLSMGRWPASSLGEVLKKNSVWKWSVDNFLRGRLHYKSRFYALLITVLIYCYCFVGFACFMTKALTMWINFAVLLSWERILVVYGYVLFSLCSLILLLNADLLSWFVQLF